MVLFTWYLQQHVNNFREYNGIRKGGVKNVLLGETTIENLLQRSVG